jgi:ribosome-associated protein
MRRMRDVTMRGDMIRLGQLLKLAGVRDTGGEVKELLAEGGITVNGEAEARRGRQLHPGDVIRVEDEEIRLVNS